MLTYVGFQFPYRLLVKFTDVIYRTTGSCSLALLNSKDIEVVSVQKYLSDMDIPTTVSECKSWLFLVKNSVVTISIPKSLYRNESLLGISCL